ncbi:hypothetical protein [Variovorax boronicumulans]|uniref:hypothetical protein n=1 Tax=Variovorax boronicumulans TaxID=436515 RepID=UPI0024749337|nr:hypothetical protein [Variovorax boronicumulans]
MAVLNLETAISGWLVGLHLEFHPGISRWLGWLDQGIEGGEENRLGTIPSWHRKTLYWAKAIGGWMHDGTNDQASWKAAQDASLEHMQIGFTKVLGPDKFDFELQRFVPQEMTGLPYSSKMILSDGLLDDFMAFSFQAEEYEAGIQEYEKHLAPSIPSLKKTLKPRELAYALCLERAGRTHFDKDDLLGAGRKMLQSNLQENWLGGGQYIRAATWLKIVYLHNDESLTPLQTILRAYDSMPKVVRPDFLPIV